MDDPLFDLDVNTTSQFRFLELLRRENPSATVVYTSTRQIFGKPRYLPVDEEHPVAPVDVNGITKYATEQLHLLYHDVYGLAGERGAPHQRVRAAAAAARRPAGVPADLPAARARRRRDHGVRRRRAGARLPLRRRRGRVPAARRGRPRRRRARSSTSATTSDCRWARSPAAVVQRRGHRSGRARALATGSRRHRHRVVLRRLVEGEADARAGSRARRSPTASSARSRSTRTATRGTCDRRRVTRHTPRSRRRSRAAARSRSNPSSRRRWRASCGRARTCSVPSSTRSRPSSPRSPVGATRSGWRRAPTRCGSRCVALGIGPGDEVIVPGVHRGAHRRRGVRGGGDARASSTSTPTPRRSIPAAPRPR